MSQGPGATEQCSSSAVYRWLRLGSGSERTVGATAAVIEGSVVVRAWLVRTGSCRRWCGSVRQGIVEVQGSATAAAGAMVQAGAQSSEAQGTAEAGRNK